jgi:ABC-2 type transport system permease protein
MEASATSMTGDHPTSGSAGSSFPRRRESSAGSIGGMGAAVALAWRELVRFARQRSRLIGALGQPILFWILFDAGLRSSFRPAQGAGATVGYGEYFFPGVLVMIVLFTAIFATISIIEDRREGFLQGVLVSPTPTFYVVLGKALGGSALALIQAWVFLLLAPFAGISIGVREALLTSGWLFLVGFWLTNLGVCMAWKTDSTQGFHALMSVFLMPMWLLSGAFFPAEGAPAWLAWVIRLNPLTYSVAGLRHLLYLGAANVTADLPSLTFCAAVNLAMAALWFYLATTIASGRGGSK